MATSSSSKPHPRSPYEPHPDTSTIGSYTPNPSSPTSLPLSTLPPSHQTIINSILALYEGKPSEEAMRVYDHEAVYDDPFSYCDNRYKIAGQWYGLPKLFSKSTTHSYEIVKDTPSEIQMKLRQEYIFAGTAGLVSKTVDSLVTLVLEDGEGGEGPKVQYHKDQWNEKDYSHEGLGAVFKKLNGDHLTKITRPPKEL